MLLLDRTVVIGKCIIAEGATVGALSLVKINLRKWSINGRFLQNLSKQQKKLKKTIIITTGIYPTQGEFTLIKYLVYSLIKNSEFNKKYDLKIFVFHENFFMKVKKLLYNFFLFFKNFFLDEKYRIHNFSYSSKEFIRENYSIKDRIFLFSNQKTYEYFDPEIILPSLTFFKKKNFKSIGYIYDLQHKDIPKLFTKKEIKRRDTEFSNIIKYNDKVFVNSSFVKKGVIKNFNVSKNRILKIPFTLYY